METLPGSGATLAWDGQRHQRILWGAQFLELREGADRASPTGMGQTPILDDLLLSFLLPRPIRLDR